MQLLLSIAGDQGLPYNPGAAFALTNYAASLGNSEAQRERGLQLAAGLHPPAFNASHKGLQSPVLWHWHAYLHLQHSAIRDLSFCIYLMMKTRKVERTR